MHMVGFRDATFFTALAMNASTVRSLTLSIYSILFLCLLLFLRSLAAETVLIRNY